jgi:hypothetical protein
LPRKNARHRVAHALVDRQIDAIRAAQNLNARTPRLLKRDPMVLYDSICYPIGATDVGMELCRMPKSPCRRRSNIRLQPDGLKSSRPNRSPWEIQSAAMSLPSIVSSVRPTLR